jgi:probable rRNA maturation factor
VNPTLTNMCPDPTPSGETAEAVGDPTGPEPEQPDEPDPAEGTGPAVTLTHHTPDCDPPASGWLEDQFTRIAHLAGVEDGQINLAIVDDERMAQWHQQYCGQPGTTDVLTFDLRDEPGGIETPVEGDIVLCIEEAARQAQNRGHDTRLELLLYAVHGLLHLLGEDDHDPADYEKMHQREDELLKRAGLGPVFGDT